MGLFDKMRRGKDKSVNLDAILEKQFAIINASLDAQNAKLDKKLSKMEQQIDEGFARINEVFENSRTFGNQTRTQQAREEQMQATVNEYYKQHPSTPQEDAEAEALLQQLMAQTEGKQR